MLHRPCYCLSLISVIILVSTRLCSGFHRHGIDEAFYHSKEASNFPVEAIHRDAQYDHTTGGHGGGYGDDYGGYGAGYGQHGHDDYEANLADNSIARLKEIHAGAGGVGGPHYSDDDGYDDYNDYGGY
ncbi:unnamed protein product [Trichobilharzia szidati]|nr:unnamed protein product [Trichobilharzia szidati]